MLNCLLVCENIYIIHALLSSAVYPPPQIRALYYIIMHAAHVD